MQVNFNYDLQKDIITFSESLLPSPKSPENNLKKMITKKTQRGRKTKCPLPKEPRCSICLEFSNHSTESLIECQVCHAQLHPSCYHKEINLEDKTIFICERCNEAKEECRELASFHCFICDESDGILIKNPYTKEYYHSLCFKLIPELYEENKSMEDVTRDKVRKWRYKNSCKYCQSKLSKSKAVIKCANPKCKDYYHIPCAIEKGMIFSTDYLYKYYCLEELKDHMAIPFYCSCHNKRLAAAYRKDVIYEKRESFPQKRKLSTISSEDITNTNTLSNVNSKTNSFFDDAYESDLGGFFDFGRDSFNSILDLNFNEITFEKDMHIPQNDMEIDFTNISPKDKIPLDFIYGKGIE